MAKLYGYDFSKSVSRRLRPEDEQSIARTVASHPAAWFRVGTMGEPCYDWELTLEICSWLSRYRAPVIVTKHWTVLAWEQVGALREMRATVNTSVSALDTPAERAHRIEQHDRLLGSGVNAILRIVTARFGNTEYGRECSEIQRALVDRGPFIDTPLRIPSTDQRVMRGDIITERRADIARRSTISINDPAAYTGCCRLCPDQCGVRESRGMREREWQGFLF